LTAIAFPRFYFCSKGARSFSFYCAAASDDFDLAPRFVFLASRVVARSARPWCLLFHVRPCHTRRREVLIFVMPCLFPPPPFLPPNPSSDIPPTHTGTTDIAQVRILHKMRKGPTVSAGTGMSTTRTSWREPEKKRISPKNIRNARDIFGAYTQNGTELYYKLERKKTCRRCCCLVCFFVLWVFIISEVSVDSAQERREMKTSSRWSNAQGPWKNVSCPQLPTPVLSGSVRRPLVVPRRTAVDY
jgi:hypothetical protein